MKSFLSLETASFFSLALNIIGTPFYNDAILPWQAFFDILKKNLRTEKLITQEKKTSITQGNNSRFRQTFRKCPHKIEFLVTNAQNLRRKNSKLNRKLKVSANPETWFAKNRSKKKGALKSHTVRIKLCLCPLRRTHAWILWFRLFTKINETSYVLVNKFISTLHAWTHHDIPFLEICKNTKLN